MDALPVVADEVLARIRAEHTERISTEQDEACRVAFVVPVYDESTDRIQRMLDSLAHQDVPLGQLEVILAVNNGPDDGSETWRRAFAANQRVLGMEVVRKGYHPDSGFPAMIPDGSRMAVHAIDLSSPGSEILECNVGKARRVALNETVSRFARRGVNGTVVHTDADCWFDEFSFVSKVLWLMSTKPDLLGLAGDSYQVLDTDDAEAEELAGSLRQYFLMRHYNFLADALANGDANFAPDQALGRCIVHRAFEGILAGGVPPIVVGEDVEFGRLLHAYADAYESRFEHGRRWGIGAATSLRISDRTPSSIRGVFLDQRRSDGSVLVADVFQPGRQVVLSEEYIDAMKVAVQQLPDGPRQLDYMLVEAPLAKIRLEGRLRA